MVKNHPRLAVRSAPKAPAKQPQRVFSRTLRKEVSLNFNNTDGTNAYRAGILTADPRSFILWSESATPFEMYRIKRFRAFALPGKGNDNNPALVADLLANIASTTMWTIPDYTNDETTLGQQMKSYQNARFHALSLNNYKMIVDTDVRLNSAQAGVVPTSTWLPVTWDPTVLNWTGFQYYFQNPAFVGSQPGTTPFINLILEIDVEFKQPGYSIPTTINSIGTVMEGTEIEEAACDSPSKAPALQK